MNVIAIVVYNKPELLYLYLEQLEKSNLIHNYKIRLFTEVGFDPEEINVINDFKDRTGHSNITLKVRDKIECPFAGFHNILQSYVDAANEADEYIIVGEEDILPTEDYLKFNDFVYENFLKKYERIFCVAHKRRPENEMQGDPEILIGDYQCTSPSCVSVKAVKKFMEPRFKDELFWKNPVIYNMFNYSSSRIAANDHTHHDGAIERIMEINNLFALKPDQARSMHVGLSGVFCGGDAPSGTIQERVAAYRELIKDGDKLRSLSNRPQDMVVTDPKGPTWNRLKLDLNRNKAKASSWWYDISNEFKEYIENYE